jgi:hypothetical protein
MNHDELLNGKQLAKALGRTENFVTAMKRAGYRLQYPGLSKTTLGHALAALTDDQFVANDYLLKGWERLPKCLADEQRQAA